MAQRNLHSNKKIRDFLMDTSFYDVIDKIVEQYKLPKGREEEFLDLTDAVMNGKLPAAKMPDFVKEAFGLSAEDAKAVAIQLVGHRLLPLDSYLEGAMVKQLKEWGAKVADFPELRIKEDPITVASLLQDQAKKLGLDLPDHLMKRFVYLTKGYLSKERSKDATTTLMKRPMNIGGLGLQDGMIEKILDWLTTVDLSAAEDYQQGGGNEPEPEVTSSPEPKPVGSSDPTARSNDRAEPAVPISKPKAEKSIRRKDPSSASPPRDDSEPAVKKALPPAKVATKAITDEVPVIAGELIHDHEKQEVEDHKQAVAKLSPKIESKRLPKTIEQATAVLIDHAPNKKLTKKKAASLAEAVIRGRLETGRLYQQLKDLHGFDAEAAQAVMLPLAKLKKEYEGSISKPKAEKSIPRNGSLADARDGEGSERKLMDRRHAALTKTPSKQSVEPVLPGARVSAARTKDEELAAQHSKVNVQAEKEAKQKDRPSKAKVKLSKPSVPPKPAPKEKTKVTDVKFTPTLVGPVEELGTMTIADFRRLASDPAEGARKVMDTLALLEDTDYEERIAGVAAWRKSPINQLYLQMVQEGLHAGSSVAEVASSRRNQGQESLSPAELQAIVSLNAQVKF